MKRKTLTLCLVLFLGLCSNQVINAQSIKDKWLFFRYKSYPKNPLPAKVKSYAVVVKGAYGNDEIVKKKINQAFNFKNFNVIPDPENADAIIEVDMQKLKVSKKEEKKETVEAVTSYWYEITYVLPTTIIISNKEKSAYYRIETFFEKESKTETGKLGTGGLVLENYYSDTSIKFLCIDNTLSTIKDILAKDYSYTDTEFRSYLYFGKGKKINYDDIENNITLIKDILKKNDITGEPSAEQKSLLETAISSMEGILTEADTINANARINKDIFCGIHYNLAVANAWAGKFDKAWKHYKVASPFFLESSHSHYTQGFSEWLTAYENSWLMNHIDKFGDNLVGTWKVSSIQSKHPLDLNKDGNRSTNVLDEYEVCKKDQVYAFSPKNLTISLGKTDECKKTESLFWRIAKNSREEKNYMLVDYSSEDLSFSDAGGIYKFIEIGYNQFTIKGDAVIDRSSDTSDEITITLTRID